MKMKLLILTLLFFLQANAFDDLQSQILGGILYSGDITSFDLEQALQRMLSQVHPSRVLYDFDTIDQPGFYKLNANVSNQITISVSNVTLDMQGHTVTGGTNGIVINSGLFNITIKNGVVNSVSSDGIQVGAGCSNITIQDVQVKNAIRGIDFEQVSNGVIKNCDFNFSTTGLLLDTCHNITVQNCTARANTHAGYDVLTSTTCSVIECQALATGNGNSDTSSEVFGFVAAYGNGNIFERCIANATMALSVTGSDSIVAGFALRGDESCTKIIDSEAANSQTNVNGVTVPYGILAEQTFAGLTQVASVSLSGIQTNTRWSANGEYIALAGSGTTARFYIYRFDRKSQSLTQIATITSSNAYDFEWSPSGRFLVGSAIAAATPDLAVYEFDYQKETISLVAFLDRGIENTGVTWSPDEQFFVVATNSGGGLTLFEFDAVSKTFTAVDTIAISGDNRGCNWSHDGNFVATVNFSGDNTLRVFQIDRATKTFIATPVATASLSSGFGALKFSPDDTFIAMQGTTPAVEVYAFDGVSLSFFASVGSGGALGGDIAWSSDGKYLSVGSTGPNDILTVYLVDRGSHELIPVGSYDHNAQVRGSGWSPDGAYIALAGVASGGVTMRILTALSSPENNVIQNNTVYCNSGAQFPSGIGISGSSILNSIIGNTAFNNPIPRGANAPIVESNYAFVTNVFNQLFSDAPTTLQNISLSGIDPILNRFDIPNGLLRLEALAESLIDNLL